MVMFFLLALLVTGLLIGGKAEAWLFPFSLFPSSFSFFVFFTFCVLASSCVWSTVGAELNLFFLSLRESLTQDIPQSILLMLVCGEKNEECWLLSVKLNLVELKYS